MNDRPILSGLKVVEFGSGLAMAAAGRLLVQAGAQVTRVVLPREGPDRALWRVLDRGKSTAGPGAESGLAELLDRADVLLHDLTPTQATARGLGDAALRVRHPRLVVAGITAFPLSHPDADMPVRETLVLAQLGLLDEQPGHRPGPVFIRLPYASWIAAWLCAIAVLARLLARRREGQGGVARTSLAQAALVPMTMHWTRAESPSPVFAKGLPKSTPIPLHQARDGRWVHVHYSPDAAPWMAQALADMGPEAVARENARHPPSHVAPNFGANKAIIATRPARDWVEHFWQHDVAAQLVAPFGEVYGDRQARTNGYVERVDDPVLGPCWQPGTAWTLASPVTADERPAVPPETTAAAGSWTARATTRSPLSGLRVLDLGAYLAGPFACMVLADLGADVIKVEPPKGDAMRRLERIFAGTQRGKRGLALQLGQPATGAVLRALVQRADVVHHNVRLPAARKLGIAPEQLHAMRPGLVCAHVSAYGPRGERADWPGFDQLMQAACGWESACGGEGNPPMWLRFGVGDHLAALASVFGVLLALLARDAGENPADERAAMSAGATVSASLLGAMLMTCSEAVGLERADGLVCTPIDRLDAEQMGVSEGHRLVRCADGWIALAALLPEERAALAAWAGGREADAPTRLATLTVSGALQALVRAGVPAAPVRLEQGEAFLDDPGAAAAQLHARYRHVEYGELQQIGALWDFGDLPLALHRPPPALGQHSAEVLRELGLARDAVDALCRAGLIHLLQPQDDAP